MISKIILCLLVFVTLGCTKPVPKKKQVLHTLVTVVPVKQEAVSSKLFLVGQVKGDKEIDVYPDTTVSGIVRRIRVNEGSLVRNGSPLMDIDQKAATGQLFNNFIVRAKSSGVVANVYVENGSLVNPQTKLCQIIQVKKLKILVSIPERDVDKVKKGQNVVFSLQSFPNKKYSGTLVQIYPSLDPNTLMLQGEVIITNVDKNIKPGMFALVDLIYENKTTVLIPLNSMLIEDNVRYVYVFNSDSQKVEYRTIKTGNYYGANIEVIAGLKPDEWVVLDGNYEITDKQQVRIKKIE